MSKRTERNSSDSSPNPKPKGKKLKSTMETQDQQEKATTQMILDSIAVLRKEMNTGLSKIQTDMDIFRNDVKVEIQSLKTTVTDVEKSLESIWAKLDESDERHGAQEKDSKVLQKEVTQLRQALDEEKAKTLALESYSRRENLKPMNLPETSGENLRSVVKDIIGQHLCISPLHMRFHAIHRVGKQKQTTTHNSIEVRPRPIITRFLCREDRFDVFAARKKLKESRNEMYKECYFTADYPPSIRKERSVLIRAMLKAQAEGKSAKVINTTLYVDGRKFSLTTIPEELKQT